MLHNNIKKEEERVGEQRRRGERGEGRGTEDERRRKEKNIRRGGEVHKSPLNSSTGCNTSPKLGLCRPVHQLRVGSKDKEGRTKDDYKLAKM